MSRLLAVSLASCLVALACSSANRSDDDSGNSTPDAGMTADAGSGGTTGGGGPDGGAELTLPEMTAVPLHVGNCTAPGTCGGDLDGVWKYADYCLPDPFSAAKQACPLLNVTKEQGTVKGAAAFGGGRVLRHAELNLDLAATVPAACASFVGGCPGIENALRSTVSNISCPAATNGDCNCTGSISRTEDDASTFSVQGSTLTVDAANGPRTFEYCVQGSSFSYRETTQGAGKEPGTGTLAK